MPTNAEETRAKQSEQDKKSRNKRATFEMLKNKPRATSTFTVYIKDEDGEEQELELKYRAIGSVEYDKLVSKHPPKNEQRVEGAVFNIDTFAPALIARVCQEPEMSEDEAAELWNSPDWSRGDLMVLFRNAVELNNRGLDIPFNGTV